MTRILTAIMLLCLSTTANSAPARISATVCAEVPILGTDDQPTGFMCLDCGNGCLTSEIPANSLPNTPPVQSFTLIDSEQ